MTRMFWLESMDFSPSQMFRISSEVYNEIFSN